MWSADLNCQSGPSGRLLFGEFAMCRWFLGLLLVGGISTVACAEDVRVEITVRDKKSTQPLPCRIHLKNGAGKPQRAGDLPFWFDHFTSPGTSKLDLSPGKYTIEIERGPEYVRIAETFNVVDKQDLKLAYDMVRLVDLAAEGWWSGDLHVHRPKEDIELLMRAEDLHVAPVITWWNKKNLWEGQPLPADPLVRFDNNRFYQTMAGEDEREGGALLYFHLKKPLAIATPSREYPSPLKFQPSTVFWVLSNLFREYSEAHPDRPRLSPHALRRRAITIMVVETQNVDLTAQAIDVSPLTARKHYLDAQRAFNTEEAFRLASGKLNPKLELASPNSHQIAEQKGANESKAEQAK